MNSSPCQAIIFDLDGTLVDTLVDIASSANRVLSSHGLPQHAAEDYRMMVGGGVARLMEQAVPEDHHAHLGELTEAFRRWYADHMLDRSGPYPGIPDLLQSIDRRGMPMAVLSNKPDDMTRTIVDRLFPSVEFRAVYGQRAEVPKKPDPTAALAIARELGVAKERCAFVGDTKTDMQTASAAGMRPIGVLWGFRGRQELLEHGAAALVEQPLSLLDAL